MSEFYADQVATIENILRCLQPHQVLVVKEHPVDKGSLIRSKFMNLRRRSSALYFLPAEVHGRQVLARTSRVVTLTSTVGWEAVATGRIVYVLGQIFYDHFPGVRRIADFNELKAALRQPEPERQTEGPAALADFVARMVMMSYPGNPFPHEGLYTEESRRKVAHAIADAALA
jgi:capsule polysaccharide modification protein KpsS